MTVLALSQIFKSVVNAKNSIEFVFEFLGVQARVVLLSSFHGVFPPAAVCHGRVLIGFQILPILAFNQILTFAFLL